MPMMQSFFIYCLILIFSIFQLTPAVARTPKKTTAEKDEAYAESSEKKSRFVFMIYRNI